MPETLQQFLDQSVHSIEPTSRSILLSLFMSFLLGQSIGWVYGRTHSGLSYSRSFAVSLVVLPTVVAVVLMLVATDIAIAFGFLAVFAVVRFRNVLKDTRDTVFVLWAIVLGMACGISQYPVALFSCAFIALVFFYLHYTGYGLRQKHDMFLRLQVSESSTGELKGILARHTLRRELESHHQQEDYSLLSYKLLMRNPKRSQELLDELQEIQDSQDIVLLPQLDQGEH